MKSKGSSSTPSWFVPLLPVASYLAWFSTGGGFDAVLSAGLAHLWFVTIHPFDDGNGRIARAIADMALARSERSTQRFYSMSAQIRLERAAYYDMLEQTQKGTLDVTLWMEWFLACLGRAIDSAENPISAVLARARLWESIRGIALNERQTLVLARVIDTLEGTLTTSRYARIARCSPDTALRDISQLIASGVLIRNPAGGRTTSYSVRSMTDDGRNAIVS